MFRIPQRLQLRRVGSARPSSLADRALAVAALCVLILLGATGSIGPAHAEPPGTRAPDWHGWLPPLGLGRGRLGVEIQPMTPELRTFLKVPTDRGVLVVRVRPDSPASAAGLAVGDVITAADGGAIARPADLTGRLARVPSGAAVQLDVVREGAQQSLSVTPDDAAEGLTGEDIEDWLGAIGGGPHRRELERRLEALEERIRELERRLETGPQGKST